MAIKIVNGQSTITGTRGADTLIGGNIPDSIFGGSSHDLLSGLNGPDLLMGGNGSDTLFGGSGNDTLGGNDGPDLLNGGTGGDLMVGGNGDDEYHVDSEDDQIVEKADGGTDSVYTILEATNLAPPLENLFLRGQALIGNGNAQNNIIQGNALGNLLQGNGGDDRLIGLGGDDTLFGGAGNDLLNGGTGADVMSGGEGDDSYYVDNAGDRVVESANGGTDSLFTVFDTATLAGALENLTLLKTARVGNGNAKDNRIEGNDQDNLLQGQAGNDTLIGNAGDDTLKGGAGSDSMSGGTGNDVYFVDDLGDVVHEEFVPEHGTDVDTVIASVSFTAGFTARIENIHLIGTDDINATRGNFASNAGELRGNAGNNTLDGSSAAVDVMLGGQGDDIYIVENPQDRVIEGAGAGDDLVRSTVDHSLSAHVEHLELQGGDINGIGNGIANTISGTDADNIINGRAGNDTLTGNAGEDTFVFDRALGPNNVDTITDMAAEDTLLLHSNVFTTLAAGALPASALAFGTAAADADDRIIYDQSTGELFYDADGSGAGAQVLFAVLDNTPVVTADMFEIA